MTDLTSIFKPSSRTLAQPAPDGRILLQIDSGEYFALDEVGDRVWELSDGLRTVADIVQAICEEYDAPATMVAADVIELLEDLADARLLVEVQ